MTDSHTPPPFLDTRPWWKRRWVRWVGGGVVAVSLLGSAFGGDESDRVTVESSSSDFDDTTTTERAEEVVPKTSTTTTEAPTTTAPPTTTTAPPPPPPPPTTTAPPPPPAPPTTVYVAPAPQPAASGCHPSYQPCVPYASDVDCAGGSGNGPAYTGPVTVVGPDEYDLDRDGDGAGCESS